MSKSPAAKSAATTRKGVLRPGPVAAPAAPAPPDGPDGSYRDYPVLADLPGLVAAYHDCQVQLAAASEIDKRRKDLGLQIEALLLVADVKSVTVGDLRTTRVETAGRKSISADALLALGVPADTIVAATVTSKPSSYVRIVPADEAVEASRSGQRAAMADTPSGVPFARRGVA